MAPHSLLYSCRIAPQVGGKLFRKFPVRRGFSVSSFNAAAQNFNMPAMSPTMTEGNIGVWKVKEGDTFSAGDVIMEIETDKAQMDVEAPDDGIIFKIFVEAGAKNIPVGTRLGVLAGLKDDLSTLEIPPEDKKPDTLKKEPPPPPVFQAPEQLPVKEEANSSAHASDTSHHPPPKYPHTPSPSVMALLHQHKLSTDDASKIPATGPKGRLLKGDVLAYLGAIPTSRPAELEALINKLSKLDLSNIKIRKPVPERAAEATKKTPESKPPPPPEIDISVRLSLDSVNALLNQTNKSLGFNPPLSTLLSIAYRKASQNLPTSKLPPSQTELFNDLVGVPTRPAKVNYIPKLIPASPTTSTPSVPRARHPIDIIDILASTKRPSPAIRAVHTESSPPQPAKHTLLLTIKREDEKRGQVFLNKVKESLETNPQGLLAAWSESVKA